MTVVTEDWKHGLRGWSFYKGRRDGELQTHVDKGCHAINNGAIRLMAKRDTQGNWTSPLLSSKLLVPPHGKLEIKVKAPWVDGIWPAVWLLGGGFPPPVPWPACGELDLLEIPGTKLYNEKPLLHGNIHGYHEGLGHWQAGRKTNFEPDQWMTIAADFTKPDQVGWLVNGETRGVWDAASVPAGIENPLPQSGMTLILSIAVGGWAGLPTDKTPAEVSMEIGTITWSL